MKFASTLSAIALFGLLASAPAFAQIESREGIDLQNQISELRRDIGELRDNAGGSGGSLLGGSRRQSSSSDQGSPSSELMTSVIERLARLEDQVRVLTGRLDEMANAQQREHDDVAKQFADLQFRLDNGGVAGVKPGTPTPAPTPTLSPPPANLGTVPAKAVTPSLPNPPLPIAQSPAAGPRTPDQLIQEGNAALARRDYTSAEQSAREVLAAKTSPRGYDAQFLLAQSLSGQKRSLDAAIAYGDLYQHSKQGAHAQDALLGLANSQAALGDKRSACVALDSLTAQFPSPRPDIAAHAAAARNAAGCH